MREREEGENGTPCAAVSATVDISRHIRQCAFISYHSATGDRSVGRSVVSFFSTSAVIAHVAARASRRCGRCRAAGRRPVGCWRYAVALLLARRLQHRQSLQRRSTLRRKQLETRGKYHRRIGDDYERDEGVFCVRSVGRCWSWNLHFCLHSNKSKDATNKVATDCIGTIKQSGLAADTWRLSGGPACSS